MSTEQSAGVPHGPFTLIDQTVSMAYPALAADGASAVAIPRTFPSDTDVIQRVALMIHVCDAAGVLIQLWDAVGVLGIASQNGAHVREMLAAVEALRRTLRGEQAAVSEGLEQCGAHLHLPAR